MPHMSGVSSIHRQVARDHGLDREVLGHARRAARPSVARIDGCIGQRVERRGKRRRVARRHEPADLRRSRPPAFRPPRGHDRHAGRHRFENRQRDPFADRAVHVHIQPGSQARASSRCPRKCTACSSPLVRVSRSRLSRSGPSPMTRTWTWRPRWANWRRRLDERLKMLDRIEAGDGADNQRVARQLQPAAQVGRGVGLPARSQFDAVVDDLDPVLGQPFGHHVPLEVVRHGCDAAGGVCDDGFSRRRLREGGASESRPCSVNTTRRPGRTGAPARRTRTASTGDSGGRPPPPSALPPRGVLASDGWKPGWRPRARDQGAVGLSASPQAPASSRQQTACLDWPASRFTSSSTSRSVPPGLRERTTCRTDGTRDSVRTDEADFRPASALGFSELQLVLFTGGGLVWLHVVSLRPVARRSTCAPPRRSAPAAGQGASGPTLHSRATAWSATTHRDVVERNGTRSSGARR